MIATLALRRRTSGRKQGPTPENRVLLVGACPPLLWRSQKYKCVYLRELETGSELRQALAW